MAEYDQSYGNTGRLFGNFKQENILGIVSSGRCHPYAAILTGNSQENDVWASTEGDLQVIHVAESVSSVLKKEVEDLVVASGARLGVEQWLLRQWGVGVSVKRLNHLLFWATPSSIAEFQQMLQMAFRFEESPLRRLDRWTEVLGPSLQVSWIRMEGIPLYAWSETVFRCIGELFGQVLEVDADSAFQRKVDCS